MFERIFAILFPVIGIAMTGFFYGRHRRPDMGVVNQLTMELFVPMLVFSAFAGKSFRVLEYGPLALVGTAVILLSVVVAWPVARLMGESPKVFVPPMMFNNSGNMGLPVMVLAFGESALPAAVILFLVEMVLHFSVGLAWLEGSVRLGRLFRQPVMLATIAGLGLSLSGWQLPEPLTRTLSMMGQVSVPLMLFSLGVRIAGASFSAWRIGVVGGIVSPLSGLVVAWVLLAWVPLSVQQTALVWLFAALPPAVLNWLVAEQYQLEPAKVAAIVMLGNLMSVPVLAGVLYAVLPAS